MTHPLEAELTPGRLGCRCKRHVLTENEHGIHFTVRTKDGQEWYQLWTRGRNAVDMSEDEALILAIKIWHDTQLEPGLE